MKMTSNKIIFGLALLAGFTLVLAQPAYKRATRPPPARVSMLNANIGVSEQIMPEQLAELRERGFTMIIDLRPDGEAIGQAPSAAVAKEARDNNLWFAYVPVPHGEIPETAIAGLNKALGDGRGKVLLYCRSGRRAARTWGLVEASRPGGLDGRAILSAIRASGQSADDLADKIAQHIARRSLIAEAR